MATQTKAAARKPSFLESSLLGTTYDKVPSLIPGTLLSAAVFVVAYYLTDWINTASGYSGLISSILVAIIIGILVRNTIGLYAIFRPGVSFCLRKVLREVEAGADPLVRLAARGLLGRADLAVLQAAQRLGNLAWALREMADSNRRRLVQRLEWPRFFLCGAGMSGPIAISYTANNPGRVAALVLRETYARASEIGRIPRMRALGALLRVDWDTYLENHVLMTFGWQAAELGPKLVAMLRECVTHDVVRELAAATPTGQPADWTPQPSPQIPKAVLDMAARAAAKPDANVKIIRPPTGGAR